MVLPESLAGDGASRREPGAAPRIDVRPDFDNQLFEPHPPESQRNGDIQPRSAAGADPVPLASSPYGPLFTNSRVFPREAVAARPYRMAGKLFWHDPGDSRSGWCSAAVIQRRLVVTAGHCVYNAKQRYWHTEFRFVPAFHEGAAPFEVWEFEQAFTTSSWTNGGGDYPNSADFAILVMADKVVVAAGEERRALGEVTGWLAWQSDIVAHSHVTILGYPGNLDQGERMQQTNSQTFGVDQASNVALFGSAHGAGSSGGPFILNFGEVAEGQTEPMPNVLVGIYSIYLSDPSTDELAWIIGTSIINGELAAMFDAACQAAPGNSG